MQLKPYFLIIVCLIFLPAAKCQDNWKLKKDKNGIKVYSRKTKAYKFDELKVECVFESRLSQLAAVILDAEHQYQWAYKTAKSEVLKQNSAADIIYYSEIECPWPFENRDLVARMTAAQNTSTKVLTIVAKSMNDYLPVKKNLVRIKYSDALWTVIPLNNTQVKVEYKIQVDPGDGVPAWVLNMFATDGPYETFINLKEKIKLPEYRIAKVPFITD
jgi:START domain